MQNGNISVSREMGMSMKLALVAMVAALGVMSWCGSGRAADDGALSLVTAVQQVAKQSMPAVVHVEVTETQEVQNPLAPFEQEPFFRYFFGAPKNLPKKFRRELFGLGSGMIIDSEGHILTNNHVVAGASKIKVVLTDGEEYTGDSVKLIGTDPKTDLAIIKINAKGPLQHITFGDSDKMEVGQWVVAIGQPRGLSNSVTQGIISAKHRRGITTPTSYQDFIQTDAAINPGNSGGPLLNLNGEVIGVNAAILSESGGFEGIGFAIPSDMAVYVSKQLIEHGKVTRGWIGVMIQDITPVLARKFGLPSMTKGTLVADVVKGGPADRAGIKRGDVIIEYNGREVRNSSTLQNDVALTPIGNEAKITLIRNGEKENRTIKIGNQEEENKLFSDLVKKRLGATVKPMTSREVEKYGLQTEQGAVITSLEPGGALAKAGFDVGDILLQIDGQPVGSAASIDLVLKAVGHDKKISILAVDGKTGQSGYVQMVLP
jgi:serine protease Do